MKNELTDRQKSLIWWDDLNGREVTEELKEFGIFGYDQDVSEGDILKMWQNSNIRRQ